MIFNNKMHPQLCALIIRNCANFKCDIESTASMINLCLVDMRGSKYFFSLKKPFHSAILT